MRPLAPREVVPTGVPGETKAERVQAMFARIVPRYDLMNGIMTGGLDRLWRQQAVALARPAGCRVLDVGAGTGDLSLALARAGAESVVAVDFTEGMLSAAQTKIRRLGFGDRISLATGDALNLPFPDASFDCVVNGFLLRNVADLPGALGEFSRVLRPGGRLACLEITHPPQLLGPFFQLYFAHVVPLIGALITGEAAAYRYLPASLGPLPDVQGLAALLRMAGLEDVRYMRLIPGSVAIHVGQRPAGKKL